MAKQVAVLAVNPVNGLGLFQYLETFFEKGITYRVFAVAESKSIRTNSGIALEADDVVGSLRGHASDYDALVFACGDAVPVFQKHASEAHNVALLEVIREFAAAGKLLAGHCAAALLFEIAGVTAGKRLAVHPLAKPAISRGIATGDDIVVDAPFLTAQCEHALPQLMPALLDALK